MKRNLVIMFLVLYCTSLFPFISTVAADGNSVSETVYGSIYQSTPIIQPNVPKKEFKDIDNRYDWAKEAIDFFSSRGIVQGNEDGNFSPEDNITREQFATLIAKLYHVADYSGSEQTFSDVQPSRWSYKYIEGVKQYLTGYYPHGLQPFYNPEGLATREDIAVALVKIMGLRPEDLSNPDILEQRFTDAAYASPTLKNYVAVAVEKNLMVGSEQKIRATEPISRAETVVLLMRAIKTPVDDQHALTTPVPVPTISPSPSTLPVNAFIQGNLEKFENYPGWYQFRTQKGYFALMGETVGMEKYLGQNLQVAGYLEDTVLSDSYKHVVFHVVRYRPTTEALPNREYNDITLQGNLRWLNESKNLLQLVTDDGNKYVLLSTDSNGISASIGHRAQFRGFLINMPLIQYPNYQVLVANGFCVLPDITPAPAPTPAPTVAPSPTPTPVDPVTKTHTVISSKPLAFKDPTVDSSVYHVSDGNCTIHWTESTQDASFKATLNVTSKSSVKVTYEFELISANYTTRNTIAGFFRIKRNGDLIADRIYGSIYGLDQPIGNYFKFYGSGEAWHFSAFITDRTDE